MPTIKKVKKPNPNTKSEQKEPNSSIKNILALRRLPEEYVSLLEEKAAEGDLEVEFTLKGGVF